MFPQSNSAHKGLNLSTIPYFRAGSSLPTLRKKKLRSPQGSLSSLTGTPLSRQSTNRSAFNSSEPTRSWLAFRLPPVNPNPLPPHSQAWGVRTAGPVHHVTSSVWSMQDKKKKKLRKKKPKSAKGTKSAGRKTISKLESEADCEVEGSEEDTGAMVTKQPSMHSEIDYNKLWYTMCHMLNSSVNLMEYILRYLFIVLIQLISATIITLSLITLDH